MSEKVRASRNRTLSLSDQEVNHYLNKTIKIKNKVDLSAIIDKTINGDSFSVLKFMPENSIDLLVVDPPYNLSKNYHGIKFNKKNDEDYELFTREWISLIKPSLKQTASIYVCCDWRSSIVIGRVLSEFFIVQNRITWQREKGRGAKSNWKNSMEDIWFATNSNSYIFNLDSVMVRKRVVAPYKENGKPKDWEETDQGNFRNTCPSNFWDDISVPYWSMPENTDHPTQKPEKLLAKLILASSNPGDLVFDPFLGSGTTSVTAKKLNRHFVGIEFNEQYCAWAEKRLELAEQDKDIQGYVDGVFWERNTLNAQKKHVTNKQMTLF